MCSWKNYPAAVLTATPEQVGPALTAHYQQVDSAGLAQAQGELGRAVALVEETPRGTLGAALRRHLGIIVAEREARGEVVA